jgi:hypothetical protein
MSMKSLNQLLGRSAIDPTVKQAFEEGRFLDLLAEYDFAPSLWNELAALRAGGFSDYAVQAYRIVQDYEAAADRAEIPSPLVGLKAGRALVHSEEQAA